MPEVSWHAPFHHLWQRMLNRKWTHFHTPASHTCSGDFTCIRSALPGPQPTLWPLQLRIAPTSSCAGGCPCISQHTLIIEAWALGYHPPITCMCTCPGLCWALWGIAGLSSSGSWSLFIYHTAACEKAPFSAQWPRGQSFHIPSPLPQMRILM